MDKPLIHAKSAFSLKKYLGLCLRYWWLIGLSVVAITFLMGLYCMKRVTEYQVDAQVMLPADSSPMGLMSEMAASFSLGDFMGGGSSTDNEMDVMRSHSVLLATAKDLGLNVTVKEKQNLLRWTPLREKAPLKISTGASVPDTLSGTLIFTIKKLDEGGVNITVKKGRLQLAEIAETSLPANVTTPYGVFTITPTEYYKYSKAKKFRIWFSNYDNAAEALAKTIKIFIPNKKTDFIGLSYVTNEPNFGKQLLSTLIDNYNQVGIDQKNESNNRTLEFVNNRLNSLTGELASSESNIANFKASNAITEPEADVQALLQKSTAIEGQLVAAQTENEILSLTNSFISNPENNYSLIPSLPADAEASSAFVSASKEINTYNGLILERMKLLNSAKGNNASLKAITDQIDALRGNIVTSVGRAYRNSQVKLAEIQKENNSAQSRIGSYPTLEREFSSMKRVQLVQEQLYLFLLKQREEVEMSIARSNPTTITIDQPHTLSETPGFSNKVMLALAVMLGLIIPMLWILLKKYNTTSMSSANEIDKQSRAPMLGKCGRIKGADKFIMAVGDNTGANATNRELIRALRHNLRHTLDDVGGNTTLVTSTHTGDGKTTIAVNLAASLALLDKRTLLIDADLRNPGVAKALNIADDSDGLRQYLEGKDTEPTVVSINLGSNRSLEVITSGGASPISAELLGHDKMRALLADLKKRYDYVVIDSASLRNYSDSFELADAADVTLYVTRVGKTTGVDLDFINSLYSDGRLMRIALVANDDRDRKAPVSETSLGNE